MDGDDFGSRFWKMLKTFLGLISDAAAYCAAVGWAGIKEYLAFVLNTGKLCLGVVIAWGLVALLSLMFRWGVPFVYSGFFVVLGFCGVVMTILVYPLWLAWDVLRKYVPQLETSLLRVLRLAGDIGFWSAMLAIYFYIVPVSNNPSAVPLLLLVAVALALATLTGRVHFNPKLVHVLRTIQLLGLVFLVTASFAFPKTMRQLAKAKLSLDDRLTERFATTKPISAIAFEDLVFFNTNSGSAQLWVDESPAGELSFYSREGFNRQTGKPFQLVETKAQIEQIRAWFARRDAARAAQLRQKQEAEARTKAEEARAKAEEAQRQAEQQQKRAAQERQEYSARYWALPGGTPNSPQIVDATVIIVSENAQPNEIVATALAHALTARSNKASATVFTSAFLSDGLFDQCFAGSRGVLDRLELTNAIDVLVLGRQVVDLRTNTALEGLVTANLKLELSAVSAATHKQLATCLLSASGPGFKAADARKAAEERLLRQLSTDALDSFAKQFKENLP